MNNHLTKLFLIALVALGVFMPATAQDVACGDNTRAITHTLGTTCVPNSPQRVVTLDMTIIELLLINEQQPVAISTTILNAYLRMHPELEGTFTQLSQTLPDFGFPPNIEVILQSQPDLIIASSDLVGESIYAQLSTVVPTVVYEPAPGDWRSRLVFAGEVLGLQDLVAQHLADYDTRANELVSLLGDTAQDTQLSLVRTFPGQIGLLLPGTAGAKIVSDLGIARPESQNLGAEFVLQQNNGRPELLIQTEELALADGDVILVFGDASELVANPLWQTLEGVKSGNAHEVGYYWWGDTLLSAHDMLDDLFAYVAKSPSTLANPFEEGFSTMAVSNPFPVTIEHKFGSTTITQKPERIVVLGYNEQDAFFALGEKPVAIRYWYGDEPNAIFPWAIEAADGATPEVLNMPYGGLNYEAILALQPDLISGVWAGFTQEEYDTLSQIAPTIAQPAEFIDFGVPWQDATLIIGQAVGKGAQATDLVAEVEGLFAQAREDNASLAGKSVAVAYSYGPAQYGFFAEEDIRSRFFTDLGMVIPQELNELAGDSFFFDLSAERVDVLDQDVLVFANMQFLEGGVDALVTDPLMAQLAVIKEERVIFMSKDLENALSFSSVLSLPYLLENILPDLVNATSITNP